ncbi:hypothetical protein GCM10022198_23320 [Klugiella xanthotipulae]|uniref:Regulator of chromosome condensation (RCC1) repeat-containing protein n=1 Tax=Klugiella xanthotipulae TaxID=244735 RepID=A0A543I5R2_9MICO|nr:hypothetical protein [Klugiella xanthotipulae]TQM65942.1 regulator of chromosome condensation (RCC1) repeat-containing protein [Klugiella xanthotipulae]
MTAHGSAVLHKVHDRAPRGRRRLVAALLTVASVIALVGGASPAASLWSISDATTTTTATARTLTALDAPTIASSTGQKITLTSNTAPSGDTLTPVYTFERSTSAAFTAPTTIATGPTFPVTDEGHLPAVPTAGTFSTIASGISSSCGLSNGRVMCWGNNDNGQLGQGTIGGFSATPVEVQTTADNPASALPATAALLEVAVGGDTACVSTLRDVYCWGRNLGGIVTTTDTSPHPLPVRVSGTPAGNLSSLTVGYSHACALFTNFGALCWGSNLNGQLGTNAALSATPAAPAKVLTGGNAGGNQVPAGTSLNLIRAGHSYTCFVTSGLAYCWGINTTGNLGNGTTTQVSVAKSVATGTSYLPAATTIIDMSLSGSTDASNSRSTCAATTTAVYCWGAAANGALGISGAAGNVLNPAKVTGVTGTMTALAGGLQGHCAVTSGQAYCWGLGTSGQLGSGSASATTPVKAATAAGKTVVRVDGDQGFRCFRYSDGTVGCAGAGAVGQLGEGPDGRSASVNAGIGTMVAPRPRTCDTGATFLSDGSCTLAPNTTYYYRVSFTLGSWKSPVSAVAALKPGG